MGNTNSSPSQLSLNRPGAAGDDGDNKNKDNNAGLFRLPGEVRNQIYSNILLFPSPIVVYRTKKEKKTEEGNNDDDDGAEASSGGDNISLFATIVPVFLLNKAISLEATTYFYTNNAFSVPDASVWPLHWERLPVMTRCFLDPVGAANARCLRHLRIRFPLYNGRYTDWYRPPGAREEDEEQQGQQPRPLLQGISSRCPNLEVLEFEARSSGQFRAQLSCCDWETQKRVLRTLAEALRAEFTATHGRRGDGGGVGGRELELVMNLYEEGCYFPLDQEQGGNNEVGVEEGEGGGDDDAERRDKFVREIGTCGWTVKVLKEKPASAAPVWTADGEVPAAPGERRAVAEEGQRGGAWRRGKERVLRRLRM